jgi:putative DNA primase/helicase
MADPVQAFRLAMLAALGHGAKLPEVIHPGKFQRFPTSERRGDSAGWLKYFADLRGGVFGCYRRGISETWSAADLANMTRTQRAALVRQAGQAQAERLAEQRRLWDANAEKVAHLWGQCVPLVPGDPVTLYLKRRGFGGVWPLPECLRLHVALPYWQDGTKLGEFPAMVAPLVANGRIVALHRTYLTRGGSKAPVPTAKKLTAAAGPLAGACIPLHLPRRGVLGIAEGIETALAGWRASSVPTVAAYCAGNLAAWQWPANVQRVVIFADADTAGQEAADTLRARAMRAGLHVEVLTPSEHGADWCDVWAQRATMGDAA